MTKYIVNPKMKGSGMLGCIPQRGRCPNNCADCFFQSGRSFLEPLADNLPNMPSIEQANDRVVRVNDGNDSNVTPNYVIHATKHYRWRFYNTAIPRNLDRFPGPVVLTINPGMSTDCAAILLDSIPPNLMFVRARTNTWNLPLIDTVVRHYSHHQIPIVLTFMAYFTESVPDLAKRNYRWRKRTLNGYWAITTAAWETVMDRYKYNRWVYSCGKTEGELGTTACRHCGNCLREFFATQERLR